MALVVDLAAPLHLRGSCKRHWLAIVGDKSPQRLPSVGSSDTHYGKHNGNSDRSKNYSHHESGWDTCCQRAGGSYDCDRHHNRFFHKSSSDRDRNSDRSKHLAPFCTLTSGRFPSIFWDWS